jgi:phage protein D
MTDRLDEKDEAYYADLADRAERGELRPTPGTAVRGAAARDSAQAMVMAATGASTPDEAVAIALGRPHVGGAGPSPVIHTRVTRTMKRSLAARAAAEHRRESDLVRDALAAYLEAS